MKVNVKKTNAKEDLQGLYDYYVSNGIVHIVTVNDIRTLIMYNPRLVAWERVLGSNSEKLQELDNESYIKEIIVNIDLNTASCMPAYIGSMLDAPVIDKVKNSLQRKKELKNKEIEKDV